MVRILLAVGLFGLLAPLVRGADCPGGLVRCPSYMTCCELANKEYGCCPFPNAICCKDHVHCCPQDMQCDVAQQTCRKNGSPLQFYWRVPIQPELIEKKEESPEETVPEVEDNHIGLNRGDKCPDGHSCPSVYTCCKMYQGGFGCCPFKDAQCCSDGFHCCPVGSHCNGTTGSCVHDQHNLSLDAYRLPVKKVHQEPRARVAPKLPEIEVSDPGGKCPDGHPCPESFTCCRVPDQGYGCCPYTDAVCCTDFIHCCPKGTNCNTTLGTCDVEKRPALSVPAFSLVTQKLAETPKAIVHKPVMNLTNVVCPDERYNCPDGNTCCQLTSGAYGCCPMDHATCCSDHMNCCPHGYRCVQGGCEMVHDEDLPRLHKLLPAKKTIKNEAQSPAQDYQVVVCPDKISVCPDENTCCDVGLGMYGCCPMPKATCCSDKTHCCPHGYRCSSAGCEKTSGDNLQQIFLKFSNIEETIGSAKGLAEPEPEPPATNPVMCPDKESVCPDENTCCKMEGGVYGCCPMPNATCCSDMAHCCPHGDICSTEGCEKQQGYPFTQPLVTAPKLTQSKKGLENSPDIPQVVLMP